MRVPQASAALCVIALPRRSQPFHLLRSGDHHRRFVPLFTLSASRHISTHAKTYAMHCGLLATFTIARTERTAAAGKIEETETRLIRALRRVYDPL